MNVLAGSQGAHVEQLYAYQVDGGLHIHAEDKSKHFDAQRDTPTV